MAANHSLTVLGPRIQTGTYILRIRLAQSLSLAFGRFRDGRQLSLPAGSYLYVGSAMGRKGATTLARRLVRHASRSGRRPPHTIRAQMLATFPTLGLGSGDLRPRGPKSLFWHVDYLLDPASVTLTHVLALRSPRRLEESLATLIATRPYTSLPFPGLGASDTRSTTHLFSVEPAPGWWFQLIRKAGSLLD